MSTTLTTEILEAWKNLNPPFNIISNNEGEEPELLDGEFSHRPSIDEVTSDFLDQSPEGYGSALSFFADEAFRYYIAAYMIAELTDGLKLSNIAFALTYGVDDISYAEKINPLRFGEQRWIDYSKSKFSMFDFEQVSCIIAFLEHKIGEDQFESSSITQALDRYWKPRLEELKEHNKAEPRR